MFQDATIAQEPLPPVYVCGIDMRGAAAGGSGPTFDPATGTIIDLGADLAGAGALITLVNQPRHQPGPFPGIIFPHASEVGTARAGITITLPRPYPHRRLMALACVTALNMGGDRTQGMGRIFVTDSLPRGTGPFVGVARFWSNGAGGTPNKHGMLWVSGGTGPAQTSTLATGLERQVIGAFTVSAGGTLAFVNIDGSQNAVPALNAGPGATVQVIDLGVLTTDGNNPFVGVLHAFHLYGLTTGDFTRQNVLDGMDLLKAQWSVPARRDIVVSWCGDSIGYGTGTLYDGVPSAHPSARVAPLATAAPAGATLLRITPAPPPRSAFFLGQRIAIAPGTDVAETVRIVSLPEPGSLVVSPPTAFAHAAGQTVSNDYYGIMTPYGKSAFCSRTMGEGSGVMIMDFSVAGARAGDVTADPAVDRSHDPLTGVAAESVFILQRGSNDLVAGTADAATLLRNARTIAGNARARGAGTVLVCQILDRIDFGSTLRAHAYAYNAAILAEPEFDGVIRYADHPVLQQPHNPRLFYAPGADNPTEVVGLLFDPSGIHPRRFAEACKALMEDAGWWTARRTPGHERYAPARPTAAASTDAESGRIALRWSPPSSPRAPRMYASTGEAPSFLQVRVRRDGDVIAQYAPASINANTGEATYLTEHIDDGDATSTYTVEVLDAAGNSSGEIVCAWTGPSGRVVVGKTPTPTSFETDSRDVTSMPPNFWVGRTLLFTEGSLTGRRATVTASEHGLLTFEPPLKAAPREGDEFVIE